VKPWKFHDYRRARACRYGWFHANEIGPRSGIGKRNAISCQPTSLRRRALAGGVRLVFAETLVATSQRTPSWPMRWRPTRKIDVTAHHPHRYGDAVEPRWLCGPSKRSVSIGARAGVPVSSKLAPPPPGLLPGENILFE
jgi:hypothetical protein